MNIDKNMYLHSIWYVFSEMTEPFETERMTKTHLFHIIRSMANDNMAT